MTTLRNVVGGMSLETALTSRDHVNAQLRGVLDEATGKSGIRINRSYQYLQMLSQLAQGSANKVFVIPSEFAEAFGGISRAFGSAKAGDDAAPAPESEAAATLSPGDEAGESRGQIGPPAQ